MFPASTANENADLTNVTVLNTPRPQASSTIERKSIFKNRFSDLDWRNNSYKSLLNNRDLGAQRLDESSLGLIDNITLCDTSKAENPQKEDSRMIDTEHELARKLLQKCSGLEITPVAIDTGKENDINIQNINASASFSGISGQGTSNIEFPSQGDNTLQPLDSKTSSASVLFEPNEITARSSGLSKNLEKRASTCSTVSVGGITLDTSTAELLAQFNNEDFQSGSQIAGQLSADEISWQQNYSYALPAPTNNEKEYLDLSCFSGIIGDFDLSLQSCAGRKVSIGEFFKRKCGNIGEISADATGRPSFGLCVESPKKDNKAAPLVDTTLTSEVFSDKNKKIIPADKPSTNTTKDIDEHSIMSLSSIAQALQDIDNGTPRKLVDQLIMAKKMRKKSQAPDGHTTGNTYTILQSQRNSMPITPKTNPEMLDAGSFNLSAKLSLDSKIMHEISQIKPSMQRALSFSSDINEMGKISNAAELSGLQIKREERVNSLKPEKLQENNDTSRAIPIKIKQNSSSQTPNVLEFSPSNKLIKPRTEKSEKNELTSEDIVYTTETNSSKCQQSEGRSSLSKNIISIKTQELCLCAVGIRRETDIELTNNSDRWIICSIILHQLQGDKQNIHIRLPENILIRPTTQQFAKISVVIKKMSNPIIAVLNVAGSDMVTKSKWNMKTIICFVPEEPNVNLIVPSGKSELNFQNVTENCPMTLPVMLENKNKLNIPVKLLLVHKGTKMFTLDNIGETTNYENKQNEIKSVVLKPLEQCRINVQCKGKLLEGSQAQSNYFEATLILQVDNEENNGTVVKELPVLATVGTNKIQVDSKLPIVIPRKQTGTLEITNTGTLSSTISICLIQSQECQIPVTDFTIKPTNLRLQCREKGCFSITYKPHNSDVSERKVLAKLILGSNSYYCPIIGERETSKESTSDNFLRCETPEQREFISSPTLSPSVNSNRISGRNSPGSSASGLTVAGDDIPIKATHASLVWNCVKPGKNDLKEFTIRNMSNNKIKILASISDNDKSFKFLRERQTVGSNIVLSLQSMESRVLSVIFNPYRAGAAAGKILFKHYEPKRQLTESRPSKAIFLYGYGGSSKVEISETFKDASSKMWLSLGTLNSGGTLRAKMKIQNSGELRAYAKINLIPKAIYPAVTSSWRIHPTELLLNPRESQWVTLEFSPRKEDLTRMRHSDVSHVGTLTVTYGDEPTRWRIRRLYNKLKGTGQLSGKENEAFRNSVFPLCTVFPGEELISDLHIIRDSIQNLSELYRCGVHQQEIILTMEVGADETLSILQDSADDSQMFQSLCSDDSHVYDGNGESFLPTTGELEYDRTVLPQMCNENFTVSPSEVLLTPPGKTEATVMVLSSSGVAQPFETALTNTDLLQVVPAEGMIPTGRGFPLKIKCKKTVERNFEAVLQVYTENDRQDVFIRIIK